MSNRYISAHMRPFARSPSQISNLHFLRTVACKQIHSRQILFQTKPGVLRRKRLGKKIFGTIKWPFRTDPLPNTCALRWVSSSVELSQHNQNVLQIADQGVFVDGSDEVKKDAPSHKGGLDVPKRKTIFVWEAIGSVRAIVADAKASLKISVVATPDC